jgi:hypothetical protein
VEQAVHNQTPRKIDKYKVEVRGIWFPPKQVIERLTGEEPVEFTTMDAQRILRRYGFEIEVEEPGQSEQTRTISELYFQKYLTTHGYQSFEFAPVVPGTTRRPDYRIHFDGKSVLAEVKEFQATTTDWSLVGGAYDPYGPIRQKIDEARVKFKGLENETCCLVLYNVDKPLIHLTWRMIYGAMLGNLAFRIPWNPELERFDDSKIVNSFGRDGKCGPASNTKISAVITLEHLMVGQRRFAAHIHSTEAENEESIPRERRWQRWWEEMENARGTERDHSLVQIRVVVHENPWAKVDHKFPVDLFKGRYDERFGFEGGEIKRVFAGEGILDLEKLEEGLETKVERFKRGIRPTPTGE